jgi:AraC family transcriptional regulator of adaptative response/methylated-DNA-[protein]-cysteine methyltransferase
LKNRFPDAEIMTSDEHTKSVAEKVVEFIETSERIDVALDIRGTPFQQSVWKALQGIPRGSTMSYSELAAKIGKPAAVRAVAHACAENPLAVVIPCHRAVRSDGTLAGYRWGLDRKKALLAREAEQSLSTVGA